MNPEAAIAAELELLDAALAAPETPILRLWRVEPCLVVTPLLAHRPQFAAAAEASAARGWPLVVRRTGGGPVPQGRQTLNISQAMAHPRAAAPDIDAAFQSFADRVCAALRGCSLAPEIGEVAGSCCPGRYDVALGGRKIVGIAQRRRQGAQGDRLLTATLVHAMLWLEGDLTAGIDALERFLDDAGAPQRFDRARMGTVEEIAGRTIAMEVERRLRTSV